MSRAAVAPLDIDKYLVDPKVRIDRIGVELEGGWKEVPKGATVGRDGSVFGGSSAPMGTGVKHVGEIPIGPFQIAALSRNLKKYYPDYVDHTCGMHVHMSFLSLRYYAWLMVPQYQATVAKYLTIWAEEEDTFPKSHHIWKRFRGDNQYCTADFYPDAQAQQKSKSYGLGSTGSRYTQIHYCGRQNTIEARILPMMQNPVQAERAIMRLIDITNACIVALADRNDKVAIESTMAGLSVTEHKLKAEVPLTSSQRRRLRSSLQAEVR